MEIARADQQVDVLASPKWTVLPAELGCNGVWGIRRYQVVETEGGLELRAGFSARDVDEALSRYRGKMGKLGFDLTVPLVYQPLKRSLLAPLEDCEGRFDEARARRELGRAARELQDQALAEAIASVVVRGAGGATHGQETMWPPELALYVGREEAVELLTDPEPPSGRSRGSGEKLLSFKAVVVVSSRAISPEVHNFARRVLAKVLGVSPEAIALLAAPRAGYCAAASAFLPVRGELLRDRGRTASLVASRVAAAINDDAFLRSLRFEPFQVLQGERNLEIKKEQATVVKTQSAWRYHRLTDDVLALDTIPSMQGMDLRWRLVVECTLAGLRGAEPLMEVSIYPDLQTKRRIESARMYTACDTNLSQLWVHPKGGDLGPIDLESASYHLQCSIAERCMIMR